MKEKDLCEAFLLIILQLLLFFGVVLATIETIFCVYRVGEMKLFNYKDSEFVRKTCYVNLFANGFIK